MVMRTTRSVRVFGVLVAGLGMSFVAASAISVAVDSAFAAGGGGGGGGSGGGGSSGGSSGGGSSGSGGSMGGSGGNGGNGLMNTCRTGKVWNTKKHACVKAERGAIPDEELTEYAYSLAKHDRYPE